MSCRFIPRKALSSVISVRPASHHTWHIVPSSHLLAELSSQDAPHTSVLAWLGAPRVCGPQLPHSFMTAMETRVPWKPYNLSHFGRGFEHYRKPKHWEIQYFGHKKPGGPQNGPENGEFHVKVPSQLGTWHLNFSKPMLAHSLHTHLPGTLSEH